jgi:tetraacyldisaccharide 4'-kinase
MSSTDEGVGSVNARARPPLPGPLGALAALIYGAAISWRNRRFDRGKGVVTFDRPVISVGNLSVGGTGKTPMVLRLARVLAEAGHRPCVAMRGYGVGGDARGGSAGTDADEAREYRRAMRSLPIVAQPDRTLGLIELFGTEHGSEVDCVILDDGFQHRQIARQYDIVLIDATRSPFDDRLLPAGWLREPVESLRRAQAAVVTHAEALSRSEVIALETRLWDYLPSSRGGIVAVARHEWTGLLVSGEEGEEERPVEWLAGKRAFVACAIGNPAAFVAQARSACELVGTLVLRDHAEYGDTVVAGLMESLKRERAEVLLVTEKDWSKLMAVGDGNTWPCPVVRPRLEMRFDRGGEALEQAVLGAVDDFGEEE